MWYSIATLVSVMLLNFLPVPLRADDIPPIVISDISKDIIADIGADIQFNCTVTNVGSMAVSWAKYTDGSDAGAVVLSMRNALSISDPRYSITKTKDENTGNVTFTFGIKEVVTNDTGTYECQVIISAAKKITAKSNLFIKHSPTISEELTSNSTLVIVGQSLELNCHANGYPKPTITWRRENNDTMPNGDNFYAGPTLYIAEIHRLDCGAYYCIADNGVGDPIEHMIRFDVEFPPKIITKRPKVAQALSYSTYLECTVQGYPAPTVVWYRKGLQLQKNSHYEIENLTFINGTTISVLRIVNVQASEYGDYHCKATNKLGNASARLNLFEFPIPVRLL